MLLGCCHCDTYTPPPSESIPSESIPSESMSSSYPSESSGIDGVIRPCAFCIGGIYPASVRIDIPAFGTPGVNSCGSYSGSYAIPNFGGASVSYISSEPVLNVLTGLPTTMTVGPNPAARFTLGYACGQNTNGSADVTLTIRWSFVSSSTPAGLSAITYNLFVPSGTLSINCLAPITLTRGTGSGGTGPCGVTSSSGWPASITVTPI